MQWRRVGSLLWEFISLSAMSLILGIGIGFFQGELSTGSQLGDIRMALPNEGAFTGALFSLPTGWIAYYLIFRRRLSFVAFRDLLGIVVLIAAGVGLAVGYFTKGDAAFVSSVLMAPMVLVATALIAARSRVRTAE